MSPAKKKYLQQQMIRHLRGFLTSWEEWVVGEDVPGAEKIQENKNR